MLCNPQYNTFFFVFVLFLFICTIVMELIQELVPTRQSHNHPLSSVFQFCVPWAWLVIIAQQWVDFCFNRMLVTLLKIQHHPLSEGWKCMCKWFFPLLHKMKGVLTANLCQHCANMSPTIIIKNYGRICLTRPAPPLCIHNYANCILIKG